MEALGPEGVRRGDAIAAFVLTLVGLAEAVLGLTGEEPAWAAATVPLVTAGIAVRTSRGGPALLVAVATALVQTALGSDLAGGFAEPLALLVLLYTLAAHRDLVPAAGWLAVTLLGLAGVVALGEEVRAGNFVYALTIAVAAWLGGRGARLAEERRGLLADRQVMLERTRIARELHDVVAHGVSGMVVQAGAERRALPEDAAAARALADIEAQGRRTLTELRRLLGVLRIHPDEAAPRVPQPGLADLPDLLESVRRAGVTPRLIESGLPAAVREGLGLVLYRVVQESLTNVVKHSQAPCAEVRLRWSADDVEVEVLDPGASRPASAPGSGYGLRAMAERVQAYGGQVVQAGPSDGGFRVLVRIPLEDTP